jgi:hypothetical protein
MILNDIPGTKMGAWPEWSPTEERFQNCSDPRVSLRHTERENPLPLLAEILRVFVHFKVVPLGEADEPFEISLEQSTDASGAQPIVIARCGDAITCERFGALCAAIGEPWPKLHCGPVPGAISPTAVTLPPAKANKPRSKFAVCARVRACEVIESRGYTRCHSESVPGIAQCARLADCAAVSDCSEKAQRRADEARRSPHLPPLPKRPPFTQKKYDRFFKEDAEK